MPWTSQNQWYCHLFYWCIPWQSRSYCRHQYLSADGLYPSALWTHIEDILKYVISQIEGLNMGLFSISLRYFSVTTGLLKCSWV